MDRLELSADGCDFLIDKISGDVRFKIDGTEAIMSPATANIIGAALLAIAKPEEE